MLLHVYMNSRLQLNSMNDGMVWEKTTVRTSKVLYGVYLNELPNQLILSAFDCRERWINTQHVE